MPTQKADKSIAPELETGQIWEMTNSNLRIGLIGKTLVHYKHYKGTCPRASVSLTGKAALKEYLVKHKAVLSKERVVSSKTATGRRAAVSA